MHSRVIVAFMVFWSSSTMAAELLDATGRTVQLPEHIAHVVPAGPPAAVALEAIAPDLIVGWPAPLSEKARALLSPDAAKLPPIPRLTGRTNVMEDIQALKPDLIFDYGSVSPRYADLAITTQQKTGIPTILMDGALPKIPETLRILGRILHREERAEVVARFAEALLVLPTQDVHPKVLYARGTDGLTVAAPNTDLTEVFARLGWQVLAPEGQGAFRTSSIEAIRALDPDRLIFAEPTMREIIEKSDAWKSVRAVHDGHVMYSPSLPFGWIEEPPSINRLIGLAWLNGRDPVTLAGLSNAVVYGHTLTPAELDTVLAGVQSVQP